MRISDWSSDVCSSDLRVIAPPSALRAAISPSLRDREDHHVRYPVESGHSFSAKKLFDIVHRELHPRRPSVVALARMRRDLHRAEQRVHFGDAQGPPCPHRPMARHRRGDEFEPLFEPERRIIAHERSEEHTYELQSLMRISYAVFYWKRKRSQK